MRPLFNTALPLIQAPMAGVQDWRLAAAVCAAGGLGSVPAGMLDAAGLEQQLAQLSAATDTPWNVNFFCHDSPAPNPSIPKNEHNRMLLIFVLHSNIHMYRNVQPLR